MRPFWHPVSALLLSDPPAFATPGVLKILLGAEGTAALRYAGDRMVPAVRQGASLRAIPVTPRDVVPGDAVIAAPEGVADLYRVDHVLEGDLVVLGADADPDEQVRAPIASIVARADLPRRREGRSRRAWRRLLLDLGEALRHGPDGTGDAAATVRDKYDGQASHYQALAGSALDDELRTIVRRAFRPGGTILVAGCGTGRECFDLAAEGFRVMGVDFSPRMIRVAREEAGRRGVEVAFTEADLRRVELAPHSLAGVFFTYDVYSFLPTRQGRVEALRSLVLALELGGRILLSARRVHRVWDRVILTLLRWNGRSPTGEWGAAHTRYVRGDGTLRRSFVHVFTARQLRRETRAAGLVGRTWCGGHGEYRARDQPAR